MKLVPAGSKRLQLAILLLLVFGFSATILPSQAAEEILSMIETYDIRLKNPYGDKLSVLPLETKAGFKTISLAIPAGQELKEHTTPTPAVLFLLEGEARFVTASGEITLVPGTVVHIPPAVPHRVVAIRNSHLVLVK